MGEVFRTGRSATCASPSSGDRQVSDLRRDALLAAGVDARHLFEDRATGSRGDRAGQTKALAFIKPGDCLIVWKLRLVPARIVGGAAGRITPVYGKSPPTSAVTVRAVRPPDQARDDPAPGREPAARLPGDGAARSACTAAIANSSCWRDGA